MEKGAFIFYSEENTIDLLLFMKCSKEELYNALPISRANGDILDNHDTLQTIFHNGYDYIGSNCLKKIPELIEKLNAVDLLKNSLSDLKKDGFLSLTEKEYNNMKNFSKRQLNIE